MSRKVMVAMSGGVDSSLVAALLKQQGDLIMGGTLQLFPKGPGENSDIDDAKKVCDALEIDHHVFSMEPLFQKEVIDYFIKAYQGGLTPNPCIACNRHIKFGALIDRAKQLDNEFIATGHYAVVEYDSDRCRYLLKKPADLSKDQTYVLYGLTQEQLAHVLFPLGTLQKQEVRNLAVSYQLVNAEKPDSQDICFISDGDYSKYLVETGKADPKPGLFLDQAGTVLGTHKGLIHYTVGQRKGLGITFGRPMYVLEKRAEDNVVILGSNEALFQDTLLAEQVNFISIKALTKPMKVKAKIRYSHQAENAMISMVEEDIVKVVFEKPQRAITPGQAVVFYDGDEVVGGGIIC